MPFDASGNYTRVHDWTTDRDNNIKIQALRMDQEMDDQAAAFNQVFLRTGVAPLTGDLDVGQNRIVGLINGTVGNPAIQFDNDVATGMWLNGLNRLAFSSQGTKRFEISTTGVEVTGTLLLSAGGFRFAPDGEQDTGIDWVSDGIISVLTNGAQSGTFNTTGWNGNVVGNLTGTASNATNAVTANNALALGGVGAAGYALLSGATFSSTVATPSLRITPDSHLIYSDGAAQLTVRISAVGPFFALKDLTGSAIGLNNASGGTLGLQVAGDTKLTVLGSGNIGIGTGSPISALHVNRAGATDTRLTIGNGVSALQAGVEGGGDSFVVMQQNAPLYFGTNGLERMRVTASGDVGIGTASPSSKLSVSGTFNTTQLTRLGTDVAFSAPNATDVIASAHTVMSGYGGNVLSFGQYPTGQGHGQWIQASFQNPTTAVYSLILQPLGGNVGIGTASPEVKFDVVGETLARGDSSDEFIGTYVRNASIANVTTKTVGYGFQGRDTIGTNKTVSKIIAGPASGDPNFVGSYLAFQTRSADGLFERMRILDSGFVGIGNTVPTERLHVTGNILASGNITAFSDARLKSDVLTIDKALDKVRNMRGVTYRMTETDEVGTGVIAQEMLCVMPEAVNTNNEYLSVAYGSLVGVLIEAIKELSDEVEALKAKL